MHRFAVLCALCLSCFASPVVQQETLQRAPPSKLGTLAYALDLSVQATPSDMSCFQRSLYNVVFVRGYTPVGAGTVDPFVILNIRNANSAGIGTEVYMTPQPSSPKTGAQQFDEMYNNLKNSNINVQTVWIQVTSPINWSSVSTTNINFLNSILARASQYGLVVGIYTSYYDWSQITGGAVITNAMLWYWNVYGVGPYDESPADFSDFRAFGGWLSAAVKQFGQNENVCGVNVNRNVYLTSSAMTGMAKTEKSDEVVVGGLLRETAALFTGAPKIIA
uniref:Glycoside hydrolase domain containing protein n=1 Tax=Haemonchus contortus TaxID=6289 RepID=A0A7I4Y175_HAECO|nr:Protein LYS-2 [Haemonchus contortus]